MATLSEFYSDAPSIPSSLWAMLDDNSKIYRNDIAITAMHQPAEHLAQLRSKSSQRSEAACLQWTFADLRHASLLMATGFHSQGVQRGTTMVTLILNGIECLILQWVSAILQLTLAPLDLRLLEAGREEQLKDYMRRLKPDVVVVPDCDGAKAVGEAAKATDLKTSLQLSLASSDAQGWKQFSSILPPDCKEPDPADHELAQDPAIDDGGNRAAIILFTSGTSTGKPKGCPRTVRGILSGTAGHFGFPSVPTRSIALSPNFGAIFQAFTLMYGSTGRHTIMPAASFSPATTLEAIEKFRAEISVAIPVMSRMFEKEMADGQARDLSTLQTVLIGGDMVTIDAKEKFGELFPSAQITVGHGMTEGHSVIGWRGRSIPSPHPEYHGILGIGHPQKGSLVRICGEDGKVLPRGEPGELHLGGPCVVDRYLEDAQPEAFYKDEKGAWLLTGDRALMDQDGVVFIIGRIKDIIKRVGMSLSPAVVESVLNKIDGVEANVFGVPHPEFGEVPLAIVKNPEQAADSSQIKKVVTESLGSDYALQDVKSLADIGFDAWPLNATGKINKHELKSAYLSKLIS